MESTQDLDISTDPETSGFDLSAGNMWIYPENYPLRDYQFTIVQAALYSNTLVCLPTGLGKTFIAAVIMYNFWRWYPRGKVIFLAPTRPLVAQQIDACHNVMGIPSTESIELTGSTNVKTRQIAWFKKRVIFATPQVFHNDLENNIIPSELVKCVVIDEAHKALGKHAYCECIRILSEKSQYFRILALSATPGNKIDNVHQVVQNLHISHIELRDEMSPDIVPYTNKRKVDIILVPLGQELEKYKERYIYIMDRHVKRLIQFNVINGHTANISKGKIFIILREFKKKPDKSGNYGQIIKTLNILLTMYHAYELMIRHGLRAFHKFYQNHSDKFWMSSECQLQELIADVETYLGPFPNVQELRNENIPNIPDNLIFGHNKFLKLKELLLQHFNKANAAGNNTRAIVFVEYRDIVSEVYILLLQARPLIRPQMFVGQAEQKQKYQIKAIEDFRKNSVNVLISTSIGEEGLDVGEVDLIICFDISQKSPTRLVQRMGRTGRKRDGHIIVLVTDGREHETLKSTIAKRHSLNSKILNTSNIFSSLYENNPRMIPNKCTPQCHKMHINVQPKTPVQKGKNSRKTNNTKTNEISTKKNKNNKQSSSKEVKDIDQPSMAKFLVNTQKDEQFCDNVEIVQPTIIATTDQYNISNSMKSTNAKLLTCNNINNVIKPSNVKLLSCDNDAIDFLTLCTMKKSEKEMTPQISKMDLTYVSSPKLVTNFFDFTVPSIDILDNLANYLNDVKNNKLVSLGDSQIEYGNNDDFWCDNQCDIMSPVKQNMNEYTEVMESKFENLFDESTGYTKVMESKFENVFDESTGCIKITESRFEDLLDESTGSDETMFDADETDVNYDNNKTNTAHCIVGSTINIQSTEKLDRDNTLNGNNDLRIDAETTVFNDIFDDSFDSIKNDPDINNIEKDELQKMNWSNDVLEKTTNQKLLKKEDNISPKMQVREEHSKNETMFTITQAIREIAQINSNADARALASDKKDTVQTTTETLKSSSSTGVLHLQDDIQIIDYISEEDMFDDDFEIDTISDELLKAENLKNDTLSDENLRYNNILTNPEQKSSAQMNTSDNFKDNTDFEVSSALVTNSNYFKNSTNVNIKDTSTIVSSFANDIMWDDTDSDEWISVARRSESQKKNSMKIAKKLSTKKNSSSNSFSHSVSFNRPIKSPDHSDNDLLIDENDMEKLNELETSYLVEKKSFEVPDYNVSVASSSNYKNISLNERKTQEPIIKNLSSFKAPDKYLKKHNSNNVTDMRSTQSNYTKDLRNFSNPNNKPINRRNKQKGKCEYIDDEAQVTSDNTQDESSGTDEDLQDFVSYTQHIPDEVDMHAVYLQNIKSPVKRHGAFIFKEPQVHEEELDVYSQPCSQVDQSYLQDTFCVGSDYDEFEESNYGHGYSILENAERVLKERKRKRIDSKTSKKKKRKIIEVVNSSSSSEDETEKLRKEICNKSMVL